MRCAKAGVNVPGLRMVDLGKGVLGMEWVQGASVREVLGGGQDEDQEEEEVVVVEEEERAEVVKRELARREVGQGTLEEVRMGCRRKNVKLMILMMDVIEELLLAIGHELAKMHLADVVHGDLTTSNMMVRLLPPSSPSSFEIVRSRPLSPIYPQS